jgi:hypothetical protein
VPAARLGELWRRRGFVSNEKASVPKNDGGLGGINTGRGVVATSGVINVAATPLYAQAWRQPWFEGTQVTVLDTKKLRALDGGRIPTGQRLVDLVRANPSVVLGRVNFHEAGTAQIRVPKGVEATIWTGSQVLDGRPPTQAQAMIY